VPFGNPPSFQLHFRAASYLVIRIDLAAGGAMPSFISHSPLYHTHEPTASKPTVSAPDRLNITVSRRQEAGKRLLGFLIRLALQSGSTDLFIVAETESLQAVAKSAGNWSTLMAHQTFHATQVLDAIESLSPSGLLTVEHNGTASVWKVAFGRVSGGEEVFLNRI
jgi:hypothetical protein